jgi:adenylate kinase
LGIEIKAKVEDLIEKEYQIREQENQKKNKNKRGYVPIDRATIQVRIPDDIIQKLCKMKLNENICRNNGFVLDGYPRSYKDARDIFLEKNPNEIFFSEEDKTNEEKYLINPNIFPNNIIILKDFADEFLKSRMRHMPEEEKKDSHYNEEGFTRRMAFYRSTNETSSQQSVQDFFKKYKSTYLGLDCKLGENDLIHKIKAFFEKVIL